MSVTDSDDSDDEGEYTEEMIKADYEADLGIQAFYWHTWPLLMHCVIIIASTRESVKKEGMVHPKYFLPLEGMGLTPEQSIPWFEELLGFKIKIIDCPVMYVTFFFVIAFHLMLIIF